MPKDLESAKRRLDAAGSELQSKSAAHNEALSLCRSLSSKIDEFHHQYLVLKPEREALRHRLDRHDTRLAFLGWKQIQDKLDEYRSQCNKILIDTARSNPGLDAETVFERCQSDPKFVEHYEQLQSDPGYLKLLERAAAQRSADPRIADEIGAESATRERLMAAWRRVDELRATFNFDVLWAEYESAEKERAQRWLAYETAYAAYKRRLSEWKKASSKRQSLSSAAEAQAQASASAPTYDPDTEPRWAPSSSGSTGPTQADISRALRHESYIEAIHESERQERSLNNMYRDRAIAREQYNNDPYRP